MRRLPLAILLSALPALVWAGPSNKTTGSEGSSAARAPATQGKTAAAPSTQARALSRALVPKRTWDRLLDRSAEGLTEAVSRSLSTKGAKVPTGLHENIRRELGQSMKYESAVDTQAHALQKRFTEDEMDSAAKFYQSPVGQKMLQHLPEAQSEVGDALQEQLAVVVPDILHRVAPGAMEPSGGGANGGPQAATPPSSPSPGEQGTGTAE